MEVSANGGTATLLITSTGRLWDPQYLPNGAVLFARFGAGPSAILVQAPGSDAHVLFEGERAIYIPTGHLVVTAPDTTPTALFARTFDPDTLRVGGPEPVAESVALRNGKTHYAIAASGALAYIYGEPDASPARCPICRSPSSAATASAGRCRAAASVPRAKALARWDSVAVEIVDADGTGSSIWVYDLAGDTDIRRLTQVTEGNNLRPIWTLDGARIAFMSDRDGPGSIYWQNADGRGPAERLTTAEEGTFHLPESWSPDGRFRSAWSAAISSGARGVFTRGAPMGRRLFFMTSLGSNRWSSAFSPDGRWLAYTSNEGSSDANDFRVFVERYPKIGERYEIAVGGAINPIWSSDGSEIFYRRGILDAPRRLNSVSILETEPRFRFTAANSVAIEGFLNHTNYRDFDPLPDGSGFIMLTPVSAAGSDDATAAPRRRPRPTVSASCSTGSKISSASEAVNPSKCNSAHSSRIWPIAAVDP